MRGERIFNIILSELTSEKLTYEEELERVINSNNDTEYKVSNIKKLIELLTFKEATIAKFLGMVENNNEEKKTN